MTDKLTYFERLVVNFTTIELFLLRSLLKLTIFPVIDLQIIKIDLLFIKNKNSGVWHEREKQWIKKRCIQQFLLENNWS